MRRRLFSLAYILQPALFLCACTAFQVSGEVQRGRVHLLRGDAKAALVNFQKAVELDPDYVADFIPLDESVWTYLGRAYYAAGEYSEARKALEQARGRRPDDYMARLYLGLAAVRTGERQHGRRELEAGLTGLKIWLESMRQSHPDRDFWDPLGELRAEIRKQLAVLSGVEIDWPELTSRVEWLGTKIEEEYDLVTRAVRKEQRGESGND